MKIKTCLFIITIFFLFIYPVESQPSSYGIKGGLNIANLYIDDIPNESSEIGFQAGIYGRFGVHPNLFLQPEILYSQKGANAFIEEQKVNIELNYIEIPVLLKMRLKQYFNVYAGTYGGFLLAKSIKFENQNTNFPKPDEEDFKSLDFGFLLGIEFNVGRFDMGARYNSGIIYVGDEGFPDELAGLNEAKNNTAQFYLGYILSRPPM